MRCRMAEQRRNIKPRGAVQRAGVIAHRDHLDAVAMQLGGGMRADIAEPLHHRRRMIQIDLKIGQYAPRQIGDAAPGGLAPPQRAARTHRLAGDDLGDGAALIHRIGVHEPRHHLFVGAHVRRHHVGVRTDERNHLLHVTSRQSFQFAPGDRGRIDADAAFRAAIGQTHQRAFPAHPDRQRRHLADIDARREARAALGRPHCQVMLHAIALEHRDRAVVAVDRAGHRDRAFRQQQPVALVMRNGQMVCDHRELPRGHVENRTGIDRHNPPPHDRCGTRRHQESFDSGAQASPQ